MHLHGQDVSAAPRQDLQLGHQPRNDVVANQIGQALFQVQWVAHTAHVSRSILDADEQRAARRVGERNQGLQRALRGGEVALEFQRLALCTLEEVEEIHML
jgi:hypothetical protein